jgi:hypothetical protein
MAMYGFTNGPVTDLIPLVKSWNNPPKLSNIEGCQSMGYDKEQRAYQFIVEDENLAFEIGSSVDSPLVNPCFVIKNIESSKIKAELEINGEKIVVGKEFRQGISYDTDGKPMLIVWLKLRAQKRMQFKFKL